jgi:hypothetical protein
MTIADLTISHGYPFRRMVDEGKDIPDSDRREAMHWKQGHPHECDILLSWQCVAMHYPGGWPALIQNIEARKQRDPIAT